MSELIKYQTMLGQLLNGQITPRSVVGRGYKNARQVASGWIRMQLHNLQNPKMAVSQIHVSSSGTAYRSESLAMKSRVYRELIENTYQTINGARVVDFGVMPSAFGDGYEIYVDTRH
jgi:hypothetical protein